MPDPSAEEIAVTREVTEFVRTYAETQTLIEAMEDAEWSAQLLDNARWVKLARPGSNLKRVGPIEFYEGAGSTSGSSLKEIRERTLKRLGLSVDNCLPTTLNWMARY